MEAGFIVDGTMSKKQRTADHDTAKDHISDLPDDLISEILSRLSTNYAVRTSALSRNWKYKWTSIYDIEIDDKIKSFYEEDGIASFSCAVTRLLRCNQNSSLISFFIYCSREGHRPSDLETWISDVLTRKVQFLEIIARKIKGLQSPWCFSSWTSLTLLRIEISCTLKVPTDNSFPNLKSLHLAGGRHGDVKIMTTKPPGSGRVELSFPVLITLQMRSCQWLDVNSVEIQAPELRAIECSCSREFINYEIKIYAPNLVLFTLCGHGNNTSLSAPAVTHVYISNKLRNETSALRAYQILTKFPNLKGLRLCGKALQALVRLKPGLKFPTFNQIKELIVFSTCNMQHVVEVLQVLPPLETLELDVQTLNEFESGGTLTHKILSRLKKVILERFSAKKGQYDFTMCLLENAKNLEKMTIMLLKKDLDSEEGDILRPCGGMAEVDAQSLLKLKPEGSICELVVI